MKKNPVYLLGLIILMILVVVWYRYKEYVINENFYINVSTSCDPSTENCFVYDCSPEEDADCDNSPYKKVDILKKEAPACLEEHSCENFKCEGLESCYVLYCTDDTAEEGEICSMSVESDSDIVSINTPNLITN